MDGVMDNNAYKEYLTKDVFMREWIEAFIVSIRGACQALANHCGVSASALEELVVEYLIDNKNQPSGYTCPTCGMWVPLNTPHSCQ